MNRDRKGKVGFIMSCMTMTLERNKRVAFEGPYLLQEKSVPTKSADFSNADNAENINDETSRFLPS